MSGKKASKKSEYKLRIIVESPEEKALKALYQSLLPETLSQPDRKRGDVKITVVGRRLIIEIESASASGARALFNAYIYLLMTALQVIKEPVTT